MSKLANMVILLGNLGQDPTVTYQDNGKAKATFTLATNEPYTDKNGNKVEHTEWHNIVLWSKQAELAEKYLHRGDKIQILGRLRTCSWEDTQANVKRNRTDIIVDEMTFLSRAKSNGQSTQAGDNYQTADDLPF